jgi:hypothetical protein
LFCIPIIYAYLCSTNPLTDKYNGKSKNNRKLNQNGWLKNSPTWRSLKNKNVKDKDRQELQEIKSWSRLKKKPSLNGGGFLLKGVGD